jgi:AbrB family looped-hinge helix DNA binding protein
MEVLTTMQGNGRIVIPNKIRKLLQMESGDTLMLKVENDVLQVIPLRQAVKLAQNKVRQHIPTGISLVDDLLDERRKASGNE